MKGTFRVEPWWQLWGPKNWWFWFLSFATAQWRFAGVKQWSSKFTEENLEKTQLEKRFSPSWLAGTSVGELMFQADYYLKELAMGEHLVPKVQDVEGSFLFHPFEGRAWYVFFCFEDVLPRKKAPLSPSYPGPLIKWHTFMVSHLQTFGFTLGYVGIVRISCGVIFQHFHLRHQMPVLGMMSVFDWSEADNVKGGWTGREWFVVNKARFVVLVVGAILFFFWCHHLRNRHSHSHFASNRQMTFPKKPLFFTFFLGGEGSWSSVTWPDVVGRSEVGTRQHLDPNCEDGSWSKNSSLPWRWPWRFTHHQQESSTQEPFAELSVESWLEEKSKNIPGKSSQIFGKSQEVCWKLQQEPGWQKEKASKRNTHLDVLDLVALALPSVSLNDFLLSQESDRFSTRPLFSIQPNIRLRFLNDTLMKLMNLHSAVTRRIWFYTQHGYI